ncbi:MAG: redoxin domain-containing protein [Acidobacteriota bacterium]
MGSKLVPVLFVSALFLAPLTASSRNPIARINRAAPPIALKDADGNKRTLEEFKGTWVVLEWTNFDCPFVKKQYAPGAMQARQEAYTADGVTWLSICSSAPGKQGHYTGEALKARLAKEKWAGTAYLVDDRGAIGRNYGAQTTPHVFIINPKGVLVYQGGIDDLRSTKPEDIFISTNYVVETLAAGLDERPIPNPKTSPYGCSVKY